PRLSLTALLVLVLVTLAPLASASPPDPSWIGGFYDAADGDDAILAVTGLGSPPLTPIVGVGSHPGRLAPPPPPRPPPPLPAPAARPAVRAPPSAWLRPRDNAVIDGHHSLTSMRTKEYRHDRNAGSADSARNRRFFLRRQEASRAVALTGQGHERIQEGARGG